jgi:hypothetical protein
MPNGNYLGVILFVAFVVISFLVIGKGCSVANKVTDADNILYSQQQFETLYEQCRALCAKIEVTKVADSVSGGFTRAERLMSLKNSLSEVVAEYNSKSNSVRQGFWRSSHLPQTLNLETVCSTN